MRPRHWIAVLVLFLPVLDADAQADLTYGPVLTRRPPGMIVDAPAPPAAVAGQAPAVTPAPAPARAVPRRHPALQGAGPLAPRPPHPSEAAAVSGMVPVPSAAAAPQPVVPTSNLAGSCVGGACTDAGAPR